MSMSRLAYNLALIGGIIMVVFGAIGLIGSGFGNFFFGWGFAYGGVLTIVAGIIAIYGAQRISDIVWSVVLIVIGAAGGGLGGLLVLIGGILGLVSTMGRRA